MSALLTKEDQLIFQRAKAFALEYIAPRAAGWEAEGKLNAEALEETRKAGFFGVGCPRELGGKGYTYLQTALTYEGLAHGDGGFAVFVQLHNNIAFEIATFYSTTDTVKALVPDLVTGKTLTAFAFTDKYGGSDPWMTTAYAEHKADGYHLFGEKEWVSNSIDAEYFTTIVKDGTPKGMVMLLVPRSAKGFSILDDRRRIGGNVMSCGTLRFADTLVPDEYLLAKEGFKEALKAIDVARIFIPAIAVGVAQRAIDLTCAYLGGREAFGKPLIQNQGLQFQLAELTAEVEAARWLVYHAAALRDAGEKVTNIAAMAKLFVPNVALKTTTQCAQFFGAQGLAWNSEISRCVNMARICKVMDGTSEIQQVVLGRMLEKQAERK